MDVPLRCSIYACAAPGSFVCLIVDGAAVDLAYSPPALLRLLRQDRGSLRSANEDDEDASARRFSGSCLRSTFPRSNAFRVRSRSLGRSLIRRIAIRDPYVRQSIH